MIPILYLIPKPTVITFFILLLVSIILFAILFLLLRKRVDSVRRLRNDLLMYMGLVILIIFLLLLFGPFPMRTYGVSVALGFLIAILITRKLCIKENIESDLVFDISVYILIGAIIGLRVLYVIFYDWDYFILKPWKIFAIWEGGLVFYGGLIGGTLAGIYAIKKKKIPLLKMLDIFSVVVPLGIFFGRWGCLGFGCCFGKVVPEGVSWGIRFPSIGNKLVGYTPAFDTHLHEGLVTAADKFSLPVYPAQIISSINGLILFFIMLFLFRRKKFDGQITSLSLMFYSITRFIIEFIRVEPSLLGLNVSQWIAILTFSLSIYLLRFSWKAHKICRDGVNSSFPE